MRNPLIANCASCGSITTIKFLIKFHPKEIQETYFKCIHCQKRTTCFVTDKKVRSLQKRIKKMTGVTSGNTAEQSRRRRQRLQAEINSRMKELKENLVADRYG